MNMLQRLVPALVFAALIGAWEIIVQAAAIPPYVLPAPSLIARTLMADWTMLSASLWVTLRITALALALATGVGVALAILFAQWRWLERSFFPVAVILQVTPIIAIAPLLLPATRALGWLSLKSLFAPFPRRADLAAFKAG